MSHGATASLSLPTDAGHPGAPQWSVQLAATSSALGCAQREVRRVVDHWELGQAADVVELLALELVSVAMGATGRNAAGPPRYRELLQMRTLELRFRLQVHGLIVATWDDDLRAPPMRQAGTRSGDGSELYWVPMLAEAWDFFRSGSGKMVWAEIDLPPAGARRLPRRSRGRIPGQVMRNPGDLVTLERVRAGLSRL